VVLSPACVYGLPACALPWVRDCTEEYLTLMGSAEWCCPLFAFMVPMCHHESVTALKNSFHETTNGIKNFNQTAANSQ
jgi:hypothetical protein